MTVSRRRVSQRVVACVVEVACTLCLTRLRCLGVLGSGHRIYVTLVLACDVGMRYQASLWVMVGPLTSHQALAGCSMSRTTLSAIGDEFVRCPLGLETPLLRAD